MTRTDFVPMDNSPLSAEEFAHLGDGLVAYVKPMRSEDVAALFPQAPPMMPGIRLFALLSADSKDAAIANAWEHELETVSVH